MSGTALGSLLEDEASGYRRIIMREIQNHKLFSRITVMTAGALLALGGGITYYSADYASLGYLLLIVGLLRLLNTFYDLQRGDDLKRSLKDMDEKFGGSKEQHRAPLRRNESA